VVKAMNAANGRANVAVAVPVEKTTVEPVLDATPASFVAPPRTINDVTAILDGEKPDATKIEALKAAADAKPPAGKSQQDLAWFYYTRASARAQLGRVNDAIEDANKAIEVARGAVDANFMGRLQQLAGLQYAFAGNSEASSCRVLRSGSRHKCQGRAGIRVRRQPANFLLPYPDGRPRPGRCLFAP
jgi:hypothetical protein